VLEFYFLKLRKRLSSKINLTDPQFNYELTRQIGLFLEELISRNIKGHFIITKFRCWSLKNNGYRNLTN